jgi:hypothetical protein
MNSLLPKTVFVVDATTDSRLLETSIVEARRTIGAEQDAAGRLNLVQATRQSTREMRAIYHALRSCEQNS